MKPERAEVIRAKASDILAKTHVLEGQIKVGSPVPPEARKSLDTALRILERIQAHLQQQEQYHDRAA